MKNGSWAYEIALALQELGTGKDIEIVDNIATRGNILPYNIANPTEAVRATIQLYSKDFKKYNSNNPSIFKSVGKGCYALEENYKIEDILKVL